MDVPAISEAMVSEFEAQHGLSFDKYRRDVLYSTKSCDIQACPGSGKTTLLVAKMLLLGSQWRQTCRGMCVLSHTNVARAEIEFKLATGHQQIRGKLLAYPHFVGTMQTFVDGFLALPLLRSSGRQVRVVDTEYTCRCLQHAIHREGNNTLRAVVRRKPNTDFLKIRHEFECGFSFQGADFPIGRETASMIELIRLKEKISESGIFRFDDMYAFAEDLLDRFPEAGDYIRYRFPVVLIDEAQDNSALQNRLLEKVFPEKKCILRHRFGDSNQQIFDFADGLENTVPFPGAADKEFPNSRRFGPWIAERVKDLALDTYSSDFCGEGPAWIGTEIGSESEEMRHTIFISDRDGLHRIIGAFGDLIANIFEPSYISSGNFTVLGQVGMVHDKSNDKKPVSLTDYWAGYVKDHSPPSPRPKMLAEFLQIAQAATAEAHGDLRVGCDWFAKGILAIFLNSGAIEPPVAATRYRSVLSLLGESAEEFGRLVVEILSGDLVLGKSNWQDLISRVHGVLSGVPGYDPSWQSSDIANWAAHDDEHDPVEATLSSTNVYLHQSESSTVPLRFSTISAAKGETHTATLVVETFFRTHNIKNVKKWLLGLGPTEKDPEGEKRKRIRQLYVAMSRPTHLLCLGVRDDCFTGEELARLQAQGWRIKQIGGGLRGV